MKQTINNISGKIAGLFKVIFHTPRKQADQKTLTRHIVALNKKHSSEQIINEVAVCLKEILNYRLFAFVTKKKDGVDVWLDPEMYKKPLEKILLKDFSLKSRSSLNYINHDCLDNKKREVLYSSSLITYELKENNCCSKVYMLPGKNTRPCHDDLVNLILQGGSVALSRQIKIDSLKNRAVIDPLTGCYNRREFTSQLKRNIAGAIRHKNDLSLFMFDLDHFKKINDTYGHQAGDRVLQEISSLVQKNMRTGDIFARYGGEEFIAVLPETNKLNAMELANRLRSKIAKKIIAYNDDTIKITASFGVAQMDQYADMEKLIQDADTMLYKAKLNGRNIVMPCLFKVIDTENPNQSAGEQRLSNT